MQPKFRHQIVAIAGDCSQPNLGISPQDRATLIREVTIVFHVAATVRFDEKMKLAMAINVRSSRDILNLCKEITNLKVFKFTSLKRRTIGCVKKGSFKVIQICNLRSRLSKHCI